MSEKSIKVTIAGRIYPITAQADEEDLVRNAAMDIDTNIKHLQDSYAVKDKQDLLAMTALQMAKRLRESEGKAGHEAGSDDLIAIETAIDKML